MDRLICLKVDVDTFHGMRRGVPALKDLFERYSLRGSFFVPMGKDHTGRTVKRVFTRPGFVKKASRTSALQTYGLRTLLYGLILPGPEIALGNCELLRALVRSGHEVGIHGLDHVYWHDHIKDLDQLRTAEILDQAVGTFREVVGEPASSFAAPGWMINTHALAWLQTHGFVYSSDTRGESPFLPRMTGRAFSIPQIPSTLPTLDEVLGVEGTTADELADFFFGKLVDGLNVLTVHAELEGKHWLGLLDRFIGRTLDAGFHYARLIDVARGLDSASVPVCDAIYGTVPGRAGEVTVQQTPCA